MNELGYLDFLSQGIPLIVTVVAIMGDTWDKSQKGFNKLTKTGWVVVGLIVFIVLPVSFYTMNESKITLAKSIDRHHEGAKDHEELNETLNATLIAADSLNEIIEDIQRTLFMEFRATGESIIGALQSSEESITDSLQTTISNSEVNLRSTITSAEGRLQTGITNSEVNLRSTITSAEGRLQTGITNSEVNFRSTITGTEDNLQTAITNSEGILRLTMTSAEGSLQTAISNSEINLRLTMERLNKLLQAEMENTLKVYMENLEIKLLEKLDSIK